MSSFNNSSFSNLLPTLQESLQESNISEPTEIQDLAIPRILSGQSLVGIAETGTGKTLAYALPVLHLIKKLELDGNKVTRAGHPRALIIAPTRELCEQITKVLKPFTHLTRLRVRGIMGGTAMDVSKKNTTGSFEILVATPGRLAKLVECRHLDLSDIRLLVFDEADQMLDKGFIQDARFIVNSCPKDKQMLLFSATLSPVVENLISTWFSGVEVIKSAKHKKVAPQLKTKNKTISNGKRLPALEELVNKNVKGGTLVFANTREQCDKIALELHKMNISCAVYRGEMDKQERRKNLKDFRDGKIQFLVSTDLASRGLDISHVGRVINYHMPQNLDNYVHRVGRTARAGRSGEVINFITERDEKLLDQISRLNPLTHA